MAERVIRAVGVVINEEMLQEAVKKLDRSPASDKVDFLVGDGENPPVKQSSFMACVFYGVLHHLWDKRRATVNASTKPLPNASVYSLDPQKSPAQIAFDFLMKLWKLYAEAAMKTPWSLKINATNEGCPNRGKNKAFHLFTSPYFRR